MEGAGEKKGKYPKGFRFMPTDEELVEYYLLPRLQGRPTEPNDYIVDADVSASHPETLTNEHKSAGYGEEWYFFSPRYRTDDLGARPARRTQDGRGWWKQTGFAKKSRALRNGVKFCKTVLNYFDGSRRKETKTKWMMHEITVPAYEIKLDKPPNKLLDACVMCKIYVSRQNKKNGGGGAAAAEVGTGSACDEEGASPKQRSQDTVVPEISENEAGKRPLVEQLQRTTATKQARQGSCSTSSAASPTAAYYGVPGQPAGAHHGLQQAPPMQWPAGAYNGQAPAMLPPGAFGGLRLAQLPTPTPVVHQLFSDAIDDYEPFDPMATLTRSPDSANQAGADGRWDGEPTETAFWSQASLQCFDDDESYCAPQPPGNAPWSQPQSLDVFPQPQQPFFTADDNRRSGAAAVAPPGTPYNCYSYQRGSLTPAADGHWDGGAASERNGAARFNANAEQEFVEPATIDLLTVESPTPAAAGAAEAESETGESSGLNTQDAA